jgi:hypothetical protein
MKIRYLLFPLLAASAQPSLAAEAAKSGAEPTIETAAGSALDRAQALRRVADAMTVEVGRPTGSNTHEAVEAMKARIKAVKRPSRPAAPTDCTDCPDKDAARQPHSASGARKTDCIHCVERAVFV